MTLKSKRNAEYAKHTNDPVLSSLKMEGIRLLFFFFYKKKLRLKIDIAASSGDQDKLTYFT
jgi:hypothetical protein